MAARPRTNQHDAGISIRGESPVIKKVRVVSNDDATFLPSKGENILITSAKKSHIADILRVIAFLFVKNPRNKFTYALINKEARFPPKFFVEFAALFWRG